jgi:cobalamin biosynthesis protein CobC
MLEHGGNLREAIARFGRPAEEWLDLSTGINPRAYPVPELAADAWHRLPQVADQLAAAAEGYYAAPHMLPVAGTQAAIQALPRLRDRARVLVASPTYAEHAYCWRQAGHEVHEIPYDRLVENIDKADVVIVCNPNNPTGATVPPELLLGWAKRLAMRGGWLIVDEAFADTTPQSSVARWSDRPGLIVLRSIGKFFGLAGLRLGFVAADSRLLSKLAEYLGPWSVSGPAQDIGIAALRDSRWQEATRVHLLQEGERLRQLLATHRIQSCGSALFQWWPEPQPEACWQNMAERGIWVRLFTDRARGIRLGLPPDETGWQRLQQALAEWTVLEEK